MSERLLDLLRHGEVQGGARFRGEQDDPLSPLGWEQMRRATSDRPGWTRIISSPSRRCADFGAWEGLAADEIPGELLDRFWADPVNYTPPGAETFAAFRARVLDGWRDLLCATDPHALLVTHGGVIRILASEVLRMSEDGFLLFEAPYACHVRLRIPDPPWRPSLASLRTL